MDYRIPIVNEADEHQKVLKIAEEMIRNGRTDDEVKDKTGLSDEDVEHIKEYLH